jgi:NADH-quinone oxidoreductase subunit H
MDWVEVLWRLAAALVMVGVVMTLAGYSVLGERKVSSWIQGRVGPNRTRVPIISDLPVIGNFLTRLGIFQLPADGLKFLFKEDPLPGHVNKVYYVLAPVVALFPALLIIAVIPFGEYQRLVEGVLVTEPVVLAPGVDLGMLFILAVSSLGVYGIVMAGWAANSKYPFYGAVRASAQMISYELAMGMSLLPVFMWANGPGMVANLSLTGVVHSQVFLWNVIWMPLPAFIFLVSLFAETNRLPFDMAESETDLVGGFHTEYGAFKFGLFFTGEYAHMFLGSAVFTLLFFGGWHFLPTFGVLPEWLAQPWAEWRLPWADVEFPAWLGWLINPAPSVYWLGGLVSVLWFILKTLGLVFFFMWVRWTLPRFRYDQVMNLGWKFLVPAALACVVIYAIVIAGLDRISITEDGWIVF